MPSRRMIDPCFWMSETMASLTMQQRLLFIGLFSNADDQGRLRAHPSLIRSMVFPYEDVPIEDIQRDLGALKGIHSIYVYAADDKPYLQIVNWWKYQSPQWAYPSDIPPPDGWHDRLRYRRDDKIHTGNWPTKEHPEVLANDLAKDLAKDDGQGDSWADSIRVSTSVSGSGSEDVPTGADAPPPIPNTFQEWEDALNTYSNHPALLKRMIDIYYPGLDPPPTYGEIGAIAKKMGRGRNGYHRLMDLAWKQSANPPKGDLLPYLLRVHQGKEKSNGRPNAHQNPHGTTEPVELATGFVEDAELPSGPDPPGMG